MLNLIGAVLAVLLAVDHAVGQRPLSSGKAGLAYAVIALYMFSGFLEREDKRRGR